MTTPTMDQQIEQLEATKEQAMEAVNLSASLRRLEDNVDFKTVVTDIYFGEHAKRLVMQKSHPAMSTPERQEALLKSIDGIGELYQFMNSIHANGIQAQQALDEYSQEMAEIHSSEEG